MCHRLAYLVQRGKIIGKQTASWYLCRLRLTVRTLASHAGNRGSIPLGGTKILYKSGMLHFGTYHF